MVLKPTSGQLNKHILLIFNTYESNDNYISKVTFESNETGFFFQDSNFNSKLNDQFWGWTHEKIHFMIVL